jgi:hypothetical protein
MTYLIMKMCSKTPVYSSMRQAEGIDEAREIYHAMNKALVETGLQEALERKYPKLVRRGNVPDHIREAMKREAKKTVPKLRVYKVYPDQDAKCLGGRELKAFLSGK